MQDTPMVESTLRVRYAETDAMGIVYHANYLVWFEVGRGDFFRSLGQDYVQWEQGGYLLPVVEVHARYGAPARYSDLIAVHTWLEHARSRSVKLGYRVTKADTQECLVTGWTRHICADRQGQMRRLPHEMLTALTGRD